MDWVYRVWRFDTIKVLLARWLRLFWGILVTVLDLIRCRAEAIIYELKGLRTASSRDLHLGHATSGGFVSR